MKVIAIMGSPHKGRGFEIVQKIEAELSRLDEVEFSYIFLKDVNLKLCQGCFICIGKGEMLCPLKDDKNNIEADILSADGVILSTPGYAMNVSALMKNFIDRFAYSLHRPKFFNQSLMLVANGGSGLSRVNSSLGMTLGGSDKVCELKITATPWEATADYEQRVQKDIEKAADRLYRSMKNKKLASPSLSNLIWFRIFKKMASLSEQNLPADYEYYRTRTDYFYPIRVNPIKNGVAGIIANIGVAAMKKQVEFK
ncbi:NAD(P)H-dependent oxidoreductase [Acetobacterium wieringae]|uniref:NAD(P)H-dependent oxidoreductase n=1 Tax=Acetobacterium wieringae TaxID=52694 RepID=UPI0026EA603E|nr:flavodoxin family protein [Acetobacterium wieringae]